jgi:hypothetical protein
VSSNLVFSPDLVDGRETTTPAIEGRVFGATQPVSLELVLAPGTVAHLREALRVIRCGRQPVRAH